MIRVTISGGEFSPVDATEKQIISFLRGGFFRVGYADGFAKLDIVNPEDYDYIVEVER